MEETAIRNSNGDIVAASPGTAQVEINYMINRLCRGDENSCTSTRVGRRGTVWIDGDVNISGPIELRTSVQVDFQGHRCTMLLPRDDGNTIDDSLVGTDAPILFERCNNAVIRNVLIELEPEDSRSFTPLTSVICFRSTSKSPEFQVSFNVVQDVEIRMLSSGMAASAILFAGIDSGILRGNTVRQVFINSAETVITMARQKTKMEDGETVITMARQKTKMEDGFTSFNHLSSIYAQEAGKLIAFQHAGAVNLSAATNENTFEHVIGQTQGARPISVENIYGRRNLFQHVGYFSRDSEISFDLRTLWSLLDTAHETIICSHNPIYLYDESQNTLITSPTPDGIQMAPRSWT